MSEKRQTAKCGINAHVSFSFTLCIFNNNINHFSRPQDLKNKKSSVRESSPGPKDTSFSFYGQSDSTCYVSKMPNAGKVSTAHVNTLHYIDI